MRAYELQHLSNMDLRRALNECSSGERESTAMLVAHIAEFDRRRLYVPEGYSSMFEYCRRALHQSEGGAFRRIRAARAARKFPALFEAIADGRLHLTAVVLLAPHLTPENFDELTSAAALKGKAEIEQLLAERFPRPDVPFRMRALPARPADVGLPPATVGLGPGEVASAPIPAGPPSPIAPGPATDAGAVAQEVDAGPGCELTLASVSPVVPNNVRSDRIVPLAPRRFALHVTIDQETQEMIRYAQSLMSHGMPSNDVAEVLKRGLQTLIAALEKRKFAATEQPRPSQSRPDANPRAIPAHVKRAVWRRDQGRCTFVGENGHRCDAREMLEFDHVMPVARGGEATVEGIRLRCRAHNYYEAERVFGAEFMGKRAKREAFAESEAREILGAT